ncbi:TIGR02281 family clan AA aspartic protease [Pseudomonas sp. R2.Fl]|nr:TIGR02281 family clan AA aspartic protease [Pseudomonas sp. R2.Fl]
MLTRSLVILAVAGTAAVELPKVFTTSMAETAMTENAVPAASIATVQPGKVTLKADDRGHFLGRFRINGKDVDGVIDTGASLIAINESTARHLGFIAVRTDFKYPIQTANGQTIAAYVKLDRVEIGSIRVKDVDAFVLKDNALSQTLIGLSFLRRLGSYTVADGRLELER